MNFHSHFICGHTIISKNDYQGFCNKLLSCNFIVDIDYIELHRFWNIFPGTNFWNYRCFDFIWHNI